MNFVNRSTLACLVATFFALLSVNVQASTNLQDDSFDVYYLDVDGDGYDDYYFLAKEKMVLIAGDIVVPIPFQDANSFIISGQTGSIEEWLADVNLSGLTSLDFDVLLGDFNGDGIQDVLLKGKTSGQESLIVYGGSNDTPSDYFAFESLEGYDVFSETLIVRDIDNDGKDDLVIDFGNNNQVVAKAISAGRFNQTRGGVVPGADVPGAIAGSFDVSKDGSASYSIPIAVPVGGAGMQPELAFSYSSGAGNGYMGMGWNVTQTSSISRCGTNIVEDGYVEADKFLCLDGQRMIEVSIDTYYLANTNFTKIESLSGGTSFKVSFKSGEVAYFGNYNGQYADAYDANLDAHYMARIEDRAGNAREYQYYKDTTTGEHYLTHITYPGGEVEYKYNTGRQDKAESWKDGNKSQILKRLYRVEAKAAGQIYRSYDLNYDHSIVGQRSRLMSISECGADGTCIEPTSFSWSDFESTAFTRSTQSLQFNDGWEKYPHFIDINGDGLNDMVLAPSGENNFRVKLNLGSGEFASADNTGIANKYNRQVQYRWGDDPAYITVKEWYYSMPIDMDGDGAVEILFGDHENNEWYVLRYNNGSYSRSKVLEGQGACKWDGDYTGGCSVYPTVLDIDGNGLADLILAKRVGGIQSWVVYLNNDGTQFSATPDFVVTAEESARTAPIDIDGDGKQELLYSDGTNWGVLEATYDEVAQQLELNTRSMTAQVYNRSSVRLVEINGDGLTDLLYKRDGKWAFSINKGGFFDDSVVTTTNYDNDAKMLDYDDDGRTDIVYIKGDNYAVETYKDSDGKTKWRSVLVEGSHWEVNNFIGTTECYETGVDCYRNINTGLADNAYKDVWRVVDLDGDGLEDLLTQKDWKWQKFMRQETRLPSYLTKVTNGYGLETEFVYGQLFDSLDNLDFYDKGQPVSFPLRNMSGPMRVVKQTRINKADGFTDVVGYQYEQLVSHMQGYGSLGFKTITATTALTKTTSTYNQDISERTHGTLLTQEVEKRASQYDSWKKVSETSYDYSNVQATDISDIRYSYLDQQIDRSWELDGTLLKTLTTDYQPDAEVNGFNTTTDFGNMIQVDQVTQKLDSIGNVDQEQSSTTVSEYTQEDSANWILGRVTNTTVTHYTAKLLNTIFTPITDTKVRESIWTYDANGYLSSEVIEPNKPELTKTTSYTYNAKGLKETVTVSSADSNLPARAVTSYYDTYGRYPTRVVNDLGAVSTVYDPVLGLKTSSTDLNGNTSYISYDGFGRPTTAIAADGTTSKTEVKDANGVALNSIYYEGWFGSESSLVQVAALPAEYYVEKTDHNGVWSRVYYDRTGKAFETRSLNAFDQQVAVTTEYDKYGDPLRQSEPYFVGASEKYWSVTAEKDALGRPTILINQEGVETTKTYNGYTTVLYNELGHKKSETVLLNGKLEKVGDNDDEYVHYGYDALGNMTSMTLVVGAVDYAGHLAGSGETGPDIVTTITYDELGRKTAMSDPNKGDWSYTYNAFGELAMQTDAENVKVCQSYDTLGRMVKRIDNYQGNAAQAINYCAGDDTNPNTTQWIYDTAANGIGLLHEITGPDGYRETYTYDHLSRVTSVTKVIAGETFVSSTSYDSQSRPLQTTYPSGLEVVNFYNSRGALTEIQKPNAGGYYWKLNQIDARGKPVEEVLATGAISRVKTYTPERGFVESIVTNSFGNTADLQFDYVEYDALANVKLRRNDIQNSQEIAEYDSINRLQHVDRTVNGVAQTRESMTYDYTGNILTKWDVSGTYQYGGTCNSVTAGHNAVTQAGGNSYCYDRNGNMVSGAGRTIDWTSFGKPSRFVKGTTEVAFEYGPDRKRIRRIDLKNGHTTTTTYVGGYEKVVKHTGVVDERHYIGGLVVVNQKTDAGNTTTEENYLLKDNLGSVVNTVNALQLQNDSSYKGDQASFNPWGQRRNTNWSPMSLASLYDYKSDVTDRGFTGHEHIDEIGLIHMNGRVYDPVLGRFISADPIIQSPTDLQSLNRYSYVRNNPLSLVDPSGFSWLSKTWKKFTKGLAKFIANPLLAVKSMLREFGRFARKNKFISEITQIAGCAASAAAGAPQLCSVITASVTYGVTDGDFAAAMKAGTIAFVQSGFASGIAGSDWGTPRLMLAHGVLGGAMSVAQGGQFGSGFAAGAIGKGISQGLEKSGFQLFSKTDGVYDNTSFNAIVMRTAIVAIGGGYTSRLAGGSFANGAVTAAMQHLFNSEDGLRKAATRMITMGGGIASIVQGTANMNRIESIMNLVESDDVAGIKELFPSLRNIDVSQREGMLQFKMQRNVILMQLSRIGFQEFSNVFFESGNLVIDELVGIPIAKAAKMAGVSEAVMDVIDIALAAGEIPVTDQGRKNRVDALLDKYQ